MLLTDYTIRSNPDRTSVSFMRNYPNRMPLFAAVVRRIAEHVRRFEFDRMYGSFANSIRSDARSVVARSAERHTRWVSGDLIT